MNINGTPNICVATLKLARYQRKLQQETNKTKTKNKKKQTKKTQERLKRVLKLTEMCGTKGQDTPVSYD